MSYHSGNQLIDPHLIFEKAHLQKGMHMADFGCGRTGHIVFPASPIVGEQGVIYAVDIMKDILENISKRAKIENLLNIHTIWSDIETLGATAIPEKTLDMVFLVNTLYHAKDVSHMLGEANRLLKEKARIAIVDWNDASLPFAPKTEEMVDFTKVKAWGQHHGFRVQEEFEAGKYHHGVVLYKAL